MKKKTEREKETKRMPLHTASYPPCPMRKIGEQKEKRKEKRKQLFKKPTIVI